MREMKDSGIDVVGAIPITWSLKRLKYLCYIQTGNEDTQNADPEGDYPFYVRSPIIEKCPRYTFDGEGILMAGDGAGAGRIFHHVYGKYAVHQRVYRLSNFTDVDTNYFYYQLSNIFPRIMDKGSAQSTVPSVRLPMLLNCEICIPPLSEQYCIASFLDAKCAEIDALTADMQTQIDTLEQYKRSVITEAVTKGLKPDAEMKDSGIEWIGEIPKEWGIRRIKYLPDLKQENSFVDGDWIESTDIADSGIRYLTTGNIDDGKFKHQGAGYVTEETFQRLHCKYAYPGDLIIARLNAPFGRACILPDDFDKYVLAVDIVILRPHESRKYLCYVTQCNGYKKTVEDKANGTIMKRISRINLGNIFVPLPTLPEQHRIASYLDTKCAEIDEIIRKKQEQLEILEEYKKSLIFEYVTGKKEVEI